jgi:hypothetical protein
LFVVACGLGLLQPVTDDPELSVIGIDIRGDVSLHRNTVPNVTHIYIDTWATIRNDERQMAKGSKYECFH